MNKDDHEEWTRIGRGGNGNVFLVINRNPQVVVKQLLTSVKEEDFRKECEILERLNHSNIVAYIGNKNYRDENGRQILNIYMEHCERGSLTETLRNPQIVYSMCTVVTWAKQLFKAIDYLYREHQFVHRDLKPANVLVKKDFTLKIGDFGSVNECKQTHTGNEIGQTDRYTSPDSVDDQQEESKFLVSHKNDVYAVGLILWEIIERKVVFEEYGNNFDRSRFLLHVFTKKLTAITKPNCGQIIQDFVIKCTNFTRSERPTADEALNTLKALTDGQQIGDGSRWHLQPFEENDRHELIRPIGFNNTNQMIPVDPSLSISNISSFSNKSASSNQEQIVEAFSFLKLSSNRNFLSAREQRIRTMEAAYQSLSSTQKQRFSDRIPEILNESMQKIYNFHDWLRKDHGDKEMIKTGDIDRIFEGLIIADYQTQAKELVNAYILLTHHDGLNYSLWRNYRLINERIEVLEDIKRFTYTTRFYLDCYFTFSTREEWLFLEDGWHLFMKRNLTEVRNFRGEWLDDEKKIFFLKSKIFYDHWEPPGFDTGNEHDELHYSGKRAIDFHEFIDALRNEREKLFTQTRIHIGKMCELKNLRRTGNILFPELIGELPVSRYYFQKRNPPRYICPHQPKCDILYFPRDSLEHRNEKKYKGILNNELQVPYYKCSSANTLAYLHEYFELIDRLKIPLILNATTYRPTVGIVSKKIEPNSFNKCFIFLCISNFLRNSANDLVLLDYPSEDRYREQENMILFSYEQDEKNPLYYRIVYHRVSRNELMQRLEQSELRSFMLMFHEKNDERMYFENYGPNLSAD